MKLIPLIIASAVILYACDKKASTSTEASKVITPATDSTKVEDTVAKKITEENVQVVAQVPAAAIATTAVATNTSGKKPALNPAHGEPFHRCDISVGAPIDSAPQQNAAPQLMPPQNVQDNNFNTNPISPSVSTSAAPVEISGPKPALNPAHGEPHHRCDLQVGAPLT